MLLSASIDNGGQLQQKLKNTLKVKKEKEVKKNITRNDLMSFSLTVGICLKET